MFRGVSEETFRLVVLESRSYNDVLKRLGLKAGSTQWRKLKRIIETRDLDTTHFTGRSWRKGVTDPVVAQSLDSLLVENSPYQQTAYLKKRLQAAGLKSYHCEQCGLDTWNGEPIPLQLHHVNGVRSDNRIENLQVLCPNCHAMTDTYAGKNTRGCGVMAA